MNNYSMFTADRVAHFKIVVVALVCATLVAGIGIFARLKDSTVANGRLEATAVKAGTLDKTQCEHKSSAFGGKRPLRPCSMTELMLRSPAESMIQARLWLSVDESAS